VFDGLILCLELDLKFLIFGVKMVKMVKTDFGSRIGNLCAWNEALNLYGMIRVRVGVN
jgi:hypothetical protein